MTFFKNRWVILIFRLFLGGMFVYASFDKIVNPEAFAKIIRNYHLIPYEASNLLAILLPWIEFYTGTCLILGLFIDGAAILSMGMMGLFIIALSQAVIRNIDIECGCFKVIGGSSQVGIQRVIEDIIYLTMAYFIWKSRDRILEIRTKSF